MQLKLHSNANLAVDRKVDLNVNIKIDTFEFKIWPSQNSGETTNKLDNARTTNAPGNNDGKCKWRRARDMTRYSIRR